MIFKKPSLFLVKIVIYWRDLQNLSFFIPLVSIIQKIKRITAIFEFGIKINHTFLYEPQA